MASSAMTSFDSLPDELALRIVKMATWTLITRTPEGEIIDGGYYHHDFLADVLCKVSIRFKRLATDYSLWDDLVIIGAEKNPRKAEFVVQECLNSGTKTFVLHGCLAGFYDVLTSPRYAEYINPTTRFPNLKLSPIKHNADCLEWIDDSTSN